MCLRVCVFGVFLCLWFACFCFCVCVFLCLLLCFFCGCVCVSVFFCVCVVVFLFVLCFTRFHQVLGWSSCLALSNQQACVRPYCFTGRPRPIGTSFSTGSMVPSLICTFLVWDSRSTGSSLQARPRWLLFKLLCHRQSSLSSTRSSYPRLAPILTLPTFATYGVGLIC